MQRAERHGVPVLVVERQVERDGLPELLHDSDQAGGSARAYRRADGSPASTRTRASRRERYRWIASITFPSCHHACGQIDVAPIPLGRAERDAPRRGSPPTPDPRVTTRIRVVRTAAILRDRRTERA